MDPAGKTFLITGSTDGVGRLVALRLGVVGANVLVHGRNAERGAGNHNGQPPHASYFPSLL